MDFNFEKRIPNALEVKSMPEEAKELIAFAKIRAKEVFPVPLEPVKR